MAATQTMDYVSLKLLVDEKRNKVIFAEAGKDFVDVLFSFLTFPLGTIARLVEKKSNMEPVTVGCLNKLYQSVRDLDKECLRSDENKGMLLQPTNSSQNYCSSLKLNIDDTEPAKYFLCTKFNGCSYSRLMNISRNKKCGCESVYTRSVSLKHCCKGFVKDGTSYLIMDNLLVISNSVRLNSLGLLQNLGVNGATSVKELIVNVTKDTVLDMLKCSLLSKTTLTDLFLRKQPFLESYKFVPFDLENKYNIQIMVRIFMRKSDGKVLYAQGEQDFADLLLSFLSYPLGGVVRALGGISSIENIDFLYKSIVDFVESNYFVSEEAKNRLLDPHLASLFKNSKQILPIENPVMRYYCFYQRHNYEQSIKYSTGDYFITDEYRSEFGGKYEMLEVESPRGSYEGYVMGPRAYMATDDLVLTPWSPFSALRLIHNLKIPLHDIKDKFVTIGIKECLTIFKASLISTSALTNGLCHLLTEVKEEIVETN
ncbi:uncharacterized protein LOC123892398 [Trifolium pratense]|uniref:uncharacterized protein LOC123892398 n=1 Tax=Trifolium pratense TaxID=57577 RepID=UPI001E695F43|nr:uncharacterized protein LOC123892398 [Trifolium pratense]